MFSEILPYLEVNQGNTEEVEEVEQIETPDIVGKTIKRSGKYFEGKWIRIRDRKCT